jgi:hypothetical protein
MLGQRKIHEVGRVEGVDLTCVVRKDTERKDDI